MTFKEKNDLLNRMELIRKNFTENSEFYNTMSDAMTKINNYDNLRFSVFLGRLKSFQVATGDTDKVLKPAIEYLERVWDATDDDQRWKL